jgi:hypothetical protein
MQEKSEQGIWPSLAPLGYRNVAGPDGKKIIAVDPESAPIVANLFEWYAIGTISLQEATRKARAAGLAYRKSGANVPVSTVHAILRNRLYPASSSGTERSVRASTSRWSQSNCESACRACSTAVTPRSIAVVRVPRRNQ